MAKNQVREPYYVGLKMADKAIGWSVTDESYNVLSSKGRRLMGVREFDMAQFAKERRSARSSRRNRQREQVRIGLLKEIFHNALMEEDSSFLNRLDNSFYTGDEKDSLPTHNSSLFADEDYTDKDYHKDYPTIYHLNLALINDEVDFDNKYVRKLYLSMLHYFKKRGNFYNKSLTSDSNEFSIDIDTLLYDISDYCDNELYINIPFSEDNYQEIDNIFSNNALSKSKKKEALVSLLDVKKSKQAVQILAALCGLKFDVNKIIDPEDKDKLMLELSSASFEDKLAEVSGQIDDAYLELIDMLKFTYDSILLSNILKGAEGKEPYKWISEAKISFYKKHKSDLKLLKKAILKHCGPEKYNHFFRDDAAGTYSSYIGSSKVKSADKYLDFKNAIIKTFEGITDDENVDYILNQLELDSFLPKQKVTDNRVIPNQLYAMEMKAILDNAAKKLPFLNTVDESGYSAKDRILMLFSFCIPYYIGPVGNNYKKNGWAVKKEGMESIAVRPWNIDEVIDIPKTGELFITNMVRKCTYISGERVLPKESLLYQKYMVLNNINNLRINNEKLSLKVRHDIYNDLFLNGKRAVSFKGLVKYLIKNGLMESEQSLSGIDNESNLPQLNTYRKFKGILGDKIFNSNSENVIEEIVFLGTVYNEKNMLKSQILTRFKNLFSEEELETISSLSFKGWGNLSKEFLNLEGCLLGTGESITLIEALWSDKDSSNLMALINSERYTFKEVLAEKTLKKMHELNHFSYEDLDGLYLVAPVKKMLWQTYLVLDELINTMGYMPKKVFYTAGSVEGGKKQKNRKSELSSVYRDIKDGRNWLGEIEKADEDGTLKSKNLYLYYKQMGKDVYTGKDIPLKDVFNKDKYTIDHIYPRHFVEDNSLSNNLVLVSKEVNQDKSDNYPLPESIRENPAIVEFWDTLVKKKLMTKKKYARLINKNPLTDAEKAEFISKDVLETSASSRVAGSLLRGLLPTSKVIYSKSTIVDNMRKECKIVKCEIINNNYYAHDAYLAIVAGNVYNTKFTDNPFNFIKERVHYNMGKVFNWDVKRNNYTAWIAPVKNEKGEIIEDNISLKTVRANLDKNYIQTSRLSKTSTGKLYDVQIKDKYAADGASYLPIKSSVSKLSDVTKYGGYGKVKNAYFFIVEHDKVKGKKSDNVTRIRTIESLPIYKRDRVESSEDGLIGYCHELGLINPKIIVKKLKPQSEVLVNGFPMYITGKSSNRYICRNACPLSLNREFTEYIAKLEKFSPLKKGDIDAEKNLLLYDELVIKHTKSIYSKKPNSIGNILVNGRDQFIKLSIDKQVETLLQVIGATAILSAESDLTNIGGSKNAGSSGINKILDTLDSFVIVNKSVCGLKVKNTVII